MYNPSRSVMEKDSENKFFVEFIRLFLLTCIIYIFLSLKLSKKKIETFYHIVNMKMKWAIDSFDTNLCKGALNFVKPFRSFPFTVYDVFPFLSSHYGYRNETNVPQITNPMEFEGERFATFVNFPNIPGVYVTRLAAAGFYYTGAVDEVVCYKCGLKYKNWKRSDFPMEIHQRLSPACVFILTCTTEGDNKSRAANIPIEGACRTSNRTHNGIESDDKKINKPTDGSKQQTFTETNGLIDYTKPTVTNVPSNNASGSVYNETQKHPQGSIFPDNFSTTETHSLIRIPETDVNHSSSTSNPSLFLERKTEHEHQAEVEIENPKYPKYANWSMRFESFKRWPRYLTQSPKEMSSSGFFFTGIEDHCRCFCCGGGLKNWESNDNPWIEHARWYKDCIFVRLCKGDKFIEDVQMARLVDMTNSNAHQNQDLKPEIKEISFVNDPAVQAVSGFGYEQSLVKKAYESLTKSSKEIPSENLLEAIFELEERTKGHDNPSGTEKTQLNTQRKDTFKTDKENTHDNENELSIRSLEEENQNLRDQQTCKICLDEPIAIVFLPCGHMASCINCAPALRRCPICRTFIKGTVKAILS